MSSRDHDDKSPRVDAGRRARAAEFLGHKQFLRQGEQAAGVLARNGVGEGDAVAVLLPMCLESVIVTLACIRLGAMRITLPVGDHVGFVRSRIGSAGARVVVTADSCRVDDRVHYVKCGLDRALWGCPEVHTVLVVSQLSNPVSWVPERDVWWHEAMAQAPPTLPAGGPRGDAPYAGGMSSTPPPEQPLRDPMTALDFRDPLDQRAPDDGDEGWGERSEDPTSSGPADLIHFLRDRPPHHL